MYLPSPSQVNPRFAQQLGTAVRDGRVMYASADASTMVCSRSMEMLGEIKPTSLQHFAEDIKYLGAGTDLVESGQLDIDGDGVEPAVVGALPLFKAPFAMRPHYTNEWLEDVIVANKKAEAEFEREKGIYIDDNLVGDSGSALGTALQLLTAISANAKDQDNPVYLPLQDDEAMLCVFGLRGAEVFSVVPNEPLMFKYA
jgi:hypothetical protein